MRGRARAFTVVELLVVIGIITLLIGFMIPTISSVQRSARSTKCASNLHQIGSACFIYLNSSPGMIPNNSFTCGDDPAKLNPPPPPGTLGASYAQGRGYLSTSNFEWFDAVAMELGWRGGRTVAARYGANEQDLFRQQTQYLWCPELDQSVQDPGVRATNYGICRNVSLAYNFVGSKPSGTDGALDFLCYKNVKQPSLVMFLSEGRFWHSQADAYDITNESLANVSRYFAATPPLIHHYGINYLFFDGHVSCQRTPPHSMGGELGSFGTADGDTYTITAADDAYFRSQL